MFQMPMAVAMTLRRISRPMATRMLDFMEEKRKGLEFASGRIDSETGLGIRVIRGEVQSSRFLALDGAVDNQGCHGHKIPQL